MKKYNNELFVGLFVFIGLLCVAYLTIKLGKMEIFSNKGYTLTAKFNSVTGLRAGSNVEIAGVAVGKVTGVRLDPDDNFRAVVEIRVQDGIRFGDDVIASIKTSGLIGDRYISLSPGGSPDILEDEGEITDTVGPVDIEELIGKFIYGKVDE